MIYIKTTVKQRCRLSFFGLDISSEKNKSSHEKQKYMYIYLSKLACSVNCNTVFSNTEKELLNIW